MARVLVVDDEKKMRHLLSLMVEGAGHDTDQAPDGVEALELLRRNTYDLVLTDIKMPRMDGVALLEKLKAEDNTCPVVFLTAFASVESAVEAMRAGAVDYITKPYEEDRILLTLERTLKLSRLIKENRDLKKALHKQITDDEIIYVSKAMATVMDFAARVANGETAVLVSGESGTGKELLARYIHHKSPRSNKRFVPVNCAAISAGLVESELFGHEKGAFTSADKNKIGKFEFASGGTLFLDEIGDLPLEARAKFLRTLQEKTIQRVGGNDEIDVDVRVICATNQNLPELVETGKFRQDLYFRINVFPINPPPLRERKSDVIPLAMHFFEKMVQGGQIPEITEGAQKALCTYNWPGNVRELANAVERSVILAGGNGKITADTLSFLKTTPVSCNTVTDLQIPPDGLSLEAVKKNLVKQALAATDNNQTAAARLLGLSRAKFRVLMKQVDDA